MGRAAIAGRPKGCDCGSVQVRDPLLLFAICSLIVLEMQHLR